MLRSKFQRLVPVAIVLAVASVGAAGYALAAGFSVSLTAQGPEPGLFTAALGDTVTVVNHDSATHTVLDRQSGLQSPPLAPGQSYEFVLTKSGRLTYEQDGPPRGSGTISVQRTGTVTLKASRRTIPFGSGVVLNGTTSLASAPVKIEQRTKGDKRWTDVTTATPAADGYFTFPVSPQLGAEYRANVFAGELLSPVVNVGVRPILTLAPRRRTVRGGSSLTLRARVLPGGRSSDCPADAVRYSSAGLEAGRHGACIRRKGLFSVACRVREIGSACLCHEAGADQRLLRELERHCDRHRDGHRAAARQAPVAASA